MKDASAVISFLVFFLLLCSPWIAASLDDPQYDHTAYTKCKEEPEKPLYNGGILEPHLLPQSASSSPALLLRNLTTSTKYSFSCWVKIQSPDSDSALVTASLRTEHEVYNCIGTVAAKCGCWSFLKGGFTLDSPSNSSTLSFQSSDSRDITIAIASASLQPFTDQQWWRNQQDVINKVRKRAVMIHVSNNNGDRLQGVEVNLKQVSKDFPFGSAIAKTILGNGAYQKWFVERFNAAVFENELKWYATEPHPGQINYTIADEMLEFIRVNRIVTRGHNIFWEDPKYTPEWVRNLVGAQLESAVNTRIQSLMSQYREEFVHWDVSNEMLHFDFYEQRLGPNATLHFFQTAHESDPLATLFMNEFNVVETCSDANSTVDSYISTLRELKRGGVSMDGIGLEGHFTVPNLPLMRAILDKLGALKLPIWLTEIDISCTLGKEAQQAIYLEEVLREGFSHPSLNGIMLWTALHPDGCYQMCLTDTNFQNLPAGDVVDNLLAEWRTKEVIGTTDEHGSYSFEGFLGEYEVSVKLEDQTANSTFALSQGVETRHVTILL
ncbi:endo-1,4-beta-xylanase 5-like isoform X1 [Syzygium oleosum]|uniref:endo-1,4-beta-xylanase 5-like isoform X1 n=1 Tax=Syzygium oleosum TaxID=219896 RepID=UPI0024B9FCAA|nr:endo-1,4-beta-xylanase 5-like isoform X1 [Syzygium oleosum]